MERNFYRDDSAIRGEGIFAVKGIRKGEVIFISGGRVLRGRKYAGDSSAKTLAWVQVGERAWLDESANTALVNHSCNPNAVLHKVGKELVALRDIKKGEEITYDYDTYDWDESEMPFECNCGSRDCRGIIKGYKYLSEAVKNRYKSLNLIPKFILLLEKETK